MPLEGGGRHVVVMGELAAKIELEASASPFVIGRSPDCHLVLPKHEGDGAPVSRWHCHLYQDKGRKGEPGGWRIADGSPGPVEGSAGPRPSAGGTHLNGLRLRGPEPVGNGDVLQAGPWRFELVLSSAQTIELLDAFRDSGRRTALSVTSTDPRLGLKFGQLHDLVRSLAQTPSFEDSLETILSHACETIAPAEVAAVLEAAGPRGFRVRMAWRKGLGKVANFRFSEALLNSLPPEQSFLLQPRLAERSASQDLNDISSGLLLPLWGKGARVGVLYLDNRRSGTAFTEEDLYSASALAGVISLQLALQRQAELARIEESMARYFAPDVVQRIVESSAGGLARGMEASERNVTVLFVDLEGFASWGHSRTPREIADFLNPYLETAALRIQGCGGHVNKFIGDSVLGIFGALPGDLEALNPARAAAQAVRAAMELPGFWQAEATRRGLPALRVRIGVDSGKSVVGNIGYAGRLEYSVVGDVVNSAARLEKLAPPDRAAVSERTRILAESYFDFEDLGDREVRGLGKMRVFSPVRALRAL